MGAASFIAGVFVGLALFYCIFFFVIPGQIAPEKGLSVESIRLFILSDPTNMVDSSKTGWNCIDYAIRLRENALKSGVPLGVVVVNVKTTNLSYGHALNCAMLKNNTIVFIEPQTDDMDVDIVALISRFLKTEVSVEKVGIIW